LIFSVKNFHKQQRIDIMSVTYRVSDNRSSIGKPYSKIADDFLNDKCYVTWVKFKSPKDIDEIKNMSLSDWDTKERNRVRRGWKDIVNFSIGNELYMCKKNDGIYRGFIRSLPVIEEAHIDQTGERDGSAFHISWEVEWNKISELNDEWDVILKPGYRCTSFILSLLPIF
jgi:hypothetical protein